MSPGLTLVLLAAAGVALVVQNLLMVRITATVSTVIITLVINAAVGLTALVTLLVSRTGLAGVTEALASARPWYILPGLLGSFFVFAGICGYQRLGAAPTIAVLVASQLLAGLIVDAVRSGTGLQDGALSILGAVLLVVGAFLVARRPF
jgi:transporter family-2 protein